MKFKFKLYFCGSQYIFYFFKVRFENFFMKGALRQGIIFVEATLGQRLLGGASV